MTDGEKHYELIKKLTDAGFTTGWGLNDLNLVLWEHEQDPPKPLTCPEK
jgi:hypothetical protein